MTWYCNIVIVVGEWLGVVEQWLLFATLPVAMWPSFCCQKRRGEGSQMAHLVVHCLASDTSPTVMWPLCLV